MTKFQSETASNQSFKVKKMKDTKQQKEDREWLHSLEEMPISRTNEHFNVIDSHLVRNDREKAIACLNEIFIETEKCLGHCENLTHDQQAKVRSAMKLETCKEIRSSLMRVMNEVQEDFDESEHYGGSCEGIEGGCRFCEDEADEG